MKGTCQGIN